MLSGNDFGGHLPFHVQAVQNSANSMEPIQMWSAQLWSRVVETSFCFPIIAILYTTSGCLSSFQIQHSLCAMFPKGLVLGYHLLSCLLSRFLCWMVLACCTSVTFYFFTTFDDARSMSSIITWRRLVLLSKMSWFRFCLSGAHTFSCPFYASCCIIFTGSG